MAAEGKVKPDRIEVSASARFRVAEMAEWEPEQVVAFFAGIGAVIAAGKRRATEGGVQSALADSAAALLAAPPETP